MAQKKFQVYKSSAGSGKTFTLVREFLRLVILNPQLYRNILAITFTNKAANEMKSRIVSSLVELTSPVEKWPGTLRTMIAPIQTETGYSDEVIKGRAKEVIGNILHNYSDLSATTIDSFMQRVIRTFSLDLNLPLNYEVELDVGMLRQRAVDRLIDKAGSDKELTNLLVHYLETKTEDDKSWRIENDLNEAAKALFREDGIQQRDALKAMSYSDYQEYYGRITNWLNEHESKLSKLGNDALKLVSDKGLGFADFSYGKSGAIGYFVKLANGQVSDLAVPGSRILAAIQDGAWTSQKKQQQTRGAIDDIAPRLIDIYNQSRGLIDTSIERYTTLKLLLKHLYPLAVLGSIENIIGEIKDEEHILPISEFNRIIAGVTQTETIPYIYERLGEKYHHLMIDEFQDTSMLQWQNLLPLVENALSENHLNLVVGDAKQAIYRWRSGEVDQFIALPHLTGDQTPVNKLREQVLISQHEDQVLPVNWRSHKAVVEFNNHFFKHLSGRLAESYKSVYESLNQQYNPVKKNGFVQAEFFDPDDDPEQKMLERLPDLINELRSINYSLRDISILCRTNRQGSEVANHLLINGINVISSESLLLGFAENVRLVVCMLRIMADAGDQLAYLEALAILGQKEIFSPLTINDVIPKILQPEEEGRSRKIFHTDAFEALLQQYGIDFSRKRLMHLPLYDLAEELIRILKLSSQNDIYLQFFLNELHAGVSKKFLAIKDLLAWWEEKGRNVSVIFPDSLDAVKVMTIHKAKGLEFPVVIFPFANGSQRYTIDNVWVDFDDPMLENLKTARLPVKSLGGTAYESIKTVENDKSLLDMVNLLYVAFTRAEERLYLLTNLVEEKELEKNTVPAFIRHFIRDTNACHVFSTDNPWVYPNSVDSPGDKKTAEEDESFFSITEKKPSRHWQQKVLTSSRSHGKWYDEEPETAIHFGTTIHELLAAIRTEDDLAIVLESYLISGALAEDDQNRIGKTLQGVMRHPDLLPFFTANKNLLSEPEILMPGGELFRPDRVLINESEIQVAEFKTGQPHISHKEQLAHYMEIIKTVYNRKIKGFLVYAGEDECTVEELS
jgi:ATP-dependent exoDNAse (exonuclease V) beta subunit